MTDKQVRLALERSLMLLREVRIQEFISDASWDDKNARKWIKKTDKLLDQFIFEKKDAERAA